MPKTSSSVLPEAYRNKAVVTVPEVAALLRVAETTVYGWVSSGILRAYRFRGSIRVATADLLEFIDRSAIE